MQWWLNSEFECCLHDIWGMIYSIWAKVVKHSVSSQSTSSYFNFADKTLAKWVFTGNEKWITELLYKMYSYICILASE